MLKQHNKMLNQHNAWHKLATEACFVTASNNHITLHLFWSMEVLTTIETTKPCNASKLVYTEDKTKHEAPTRREGKVRGSKASMVQACESTCSYPRFIYDNNKHIVSVDLSTL